MKMTDKEISLDLATLTFLVQCLLHHQTEKERESMRLEIKSALTEQKYPKYAYAFSHQEMQVSVDDFLEQCL
jgi:hypothetical protein